jgi:hypothetical protein
MVSHKVVIIWQKSFKNTEKKRKNLMVFRVTSVKISCKVENIVEQKNQKSIANIVIIVSVQNYFGCHTELEGIFT